MHGKHMIKLLSSTQGVESLSTGESEWYGLVHTASVGIGMINMANDMKWSTKLKLAGDATAASGIANRRGAGRVRHIETRTLWLQRHITERRIVLEREPGVSNPADLGTKHLDAGKVKEIITILGFVPREGASNSALQAAV